MARKIRTRVIEEYETDADESPPLLTRSASPEKPRGGRRWKRLAFFLLLLGVLAWLAPWIVSATGLWKSLLPLAVPELGGKIDAQSLSLGWLSPIEARGVRLTGPDGRRLAEIDAAATQHSLLELLLYPSDVGSIRLSAPRVFLSLREDGSNLEDFLASLAARSSDQGKALGFTLAIDEGSVEVEDLIAGRRWALDGIRGNFAWPAAEDQPKTGKLSAALIAGGDDPEEAERGELTAEIAWRPGSTVEDSLGSGQIDAELTAVPAQAVEGIIRRFALDLRPHGPVTANGRYEWADNFATQKITVNQSVSPQLEIGSPLIGQQPIRAQVSQLSGVVDLSNGAITASDLRLESDVARLRGSAALALTSYSLDGLIAALQSARPSEGVALEGEIDLALVAEQLRQTLRLKDDTRITEGLIRLSVGSKSIGPAPASRGWEATLKLDKLAAEASGNPITWDQPVQLTCVIQQQPQGLAIREISAEASFARVQGSGTLAEGKITADADLDQLRRELSRFADLGSGELAGTLASALRWQQDQETWSATAEARVQEFQLAFPGMVPWREEDLQISGEAAGRMRGVGLDVLDEGRLTLGSGGDKLEVALLEPVPTPSLASTWPVSYSLVGRLETWLPRVQTWLPPGGWNASGSIDLAGTGAYSPQRVALEQLALRLTDLSVRHFVDVQPPVVLLSIQEPLVKIDTTVHWDRAHAKLVSPSTTVASSAVAFRADDVALEYGERLSLTGVVDYRGDLARLSAWIGDGATRPYLLGGMVVGRIDAAAREGIVEASFSGDFENLSYLTREVLPRPSGATTASSRTSDWQLAWVEPKVGLSGEGVYDPARDRLTLSRAKVDAAAISLSAAGTIEELTRSCVTNLRGHLACDMASVAQKLRPIVGETLDMSGKQDREFELKGPLFSQALPLASQGERRLASLGAGQVRNLSDVSGRGGIGWEQAQFLGLSAGAANLDATLKEGVVAFEPLDVPLSEGRLLAAPRIDLAAPGVPLILSKGPAIERVRISPELCRGWLKYIAPLLADATRAEGKFSVDIHQAAVPLLEPGAMDVGGIVSIHEAQIGPGPLAVTYLELALQVKAILSGKSPQTASIDPSKGWILLPEQQVPMRTMAGRVHHQKLTMQVNDVVFYTQGSVGFDQTLELSAVIPVQEKWIEKDKLPAFLRGQEIVIPIHGHITRPEPDRKMLTALAQQLLVGAGQKALERELLKGRSRIEEELKKGLDQLFNPKP